jgi:signal transduction histidine kinase
MNVPRRRHGASSGGDPAAVEALTQGGLTRRVVVASTLLALVVGAAFLALLIAIDRARGAEHRTHNSQQLLIAANALERLLLDLETGQRGFVITRQERFLQPWAATRRSFPKRAGTLLKLVDGGPAEETWARRIARAGQSYIDDYSVPLVEAARRDQPYADSVAATAAGKRRMDAIRADFDRLVAAEQRAVASSEDRASRDVRLTAAAAIVGVAGSIVLIALYAGYLTRAIVRPVRRAAAMADRLAGGDFAARLPETGAGEIGTLERAFNVMGSSLQRGRDELAALADEQAALRRVATLVAEAAPPAAVFSAVAEELGRLLAPDVTAVARYEGDDAITVVSSWSSAGTNPLPTGSRRPVTAGSPAVRVRDTGRTVRTDHIATNDTGLRSSVAAPVTVEGRLWGTMIVASVTDVPPPPGTEARLAGFAELVATAIANAEAQAELTASRARIVASADDTRRRIERDLHDGAQQQLVSLALQLRAARAEVPEDLAGLATELDQVASGLNVALDELREFARGIHPAILAEGGLESALKTLGRRSSVPIQLDVQLEGRLPQPVEVGAYYIVSEALANTAKHAEASRVAVDVVADHGVLRISVRDDGVGGAHFAHGSGLVGLRDRVETLGGRIVLRSERREGTSLSVELPLAGGADAV